jgi:DNA primase large subunit
MDGELDFSVKYPFSASAKRAIEGISLTGRIVDLGLERIRKALKGESAAKMLIHESDKKEEIASFAAARMILGSLRNNFLTNRFAVSESKIVGRHLDRESEATVDAVAAQFGIAARTENGRTVIDLPTYVRYSLRNPHYRLINRKLVNGKVEITENEKKRLIEEAVKKHNEDIPLVKDPPDIIKEAGNKLLAELPKTENRKLETIKAGDHPPCIMKLFDEMKKHQNLPHHARWYLATYLLGIGMKEEDITKLYSDLPDFNEKITSYQVGHIKKKGYNVPSCATVMTYGLCCAVCRIGNPLNWHTLGEERKLSIKTRGA